MLKLQMLPREMRSGGVAALMYGANERPTGHVRGDSPAALGAAERGRAASADDGAEARLAQEQAVLPPSSPCAEGKLGALARRDGEAPLPGEAPLAALLIEHVALAKGRRSKCGALLPRSRWEASKGPGASLVATSKGHRFREGWRPRSARNMAGNGGMWGNMRWTSGDSSAATTNAAGPTTDAPATAASRGGRAPCEEARAIHGPRANGGS